MTLTHITLGFCALAFFFYGVSCIYSPHMRVEFTRYGLSQFRVMTGILQVLAAIGLALGVAYPILGGIAAGGVALQMACGLGVRIHIGDKWYQCIAAAFFMLICGWLAVHIL